MTEVWLVLVGALASLAGNALTQFFASRREERLWQRQKEAAESQRLHDRQSEERALLRGAYQQSMSALSTYMAATAGMEQNVQEQPPGLIEEVMKCVPQLLLRHPSSELLKLLHGFTLEPNEFSAEYLRDEVVRLAKGELEFYSTEFQEIPSLDAPLNGKRTVTVTMDNDYRIEQLVLGIEVPVEASFILDLSTITQSQRRKLALLHGYLPAGFRLSLPRAGRAPTPGRLKVAGSWLARINPERVQPPEVIAEWEKDFDAALAAEPDVPKINR